MLRLWRGWWWWLLGGLAPVVAVQAQLAVPSQATAAVPLVLRGVTVIDVEAGRKLENRTVVIVGNRIRSIGPASTTRVSKRAHVVNARGQYLIPGLWDMHVHVWDYASVAYPLFVAYGVTGVREMGTPVSLDRIARWRRDVTGGARVGPHVVSPGPLLQSSGDPTAGIRGFDYLIIDTPKQGRRAVDSLQAAGADFIKLHSSTMARATYFAILAEGRQRGIPVVGHLSNEVTGLEASDSGQHSLEHLDGTHDCGLADGHGSEAACANLVAHFLRNETWVVPTLSSIYSMRDSAPMARSIAPHYWPDSAWDNADRDFGLVREILRGMQNEVTRGQQRIAALRSAGLPILAGTDASPAEPENLFGFSLHEELELFVGAGLTPLEALQAATLNAAKFFRATDSLGTAAPGKLADLVLLDADPLVNIKHTRQIRAVVANGRYYDRPALDGLLQAVEAAARRHDDSQPGR